MAPLTVARSLFIHLFIYLFNYLFIYLFILSFFLSLFIYLFIYLIIYSFVCLFIYLFMPVSLSSLRKISHKEGICKKLHLYFLKLSHLRAVACHWFELLHGCQPL